MDIKEEREGYVIQFGCRYLGRTSGILEMCL